ncbi:esterase-like activity of phytase family protein [Actinomadura alba]|uniref:Esterase-like activity of phytase family protein n=1 Tax=Actinomadura alba TaxID=406431 RepID=A0ABR7LTC7_9ACTN|nr:esterase-like activity of phytase family protein [Actinomadura alba]MBC6468051.1 esterase-like activity of phytase family protein [Actinomadura alba]
MRKPVLGLIIACGVTAALIGSGSASSAATPQGAAAAESDPNRAELTGFARLPAESFVPGSEPSGSALGTEPINGVRPPFAHQPIQGFSGVIRNRDGSFDALSDNGFGAKANSADFQLRIHRIAPRFSTGLIQVRGGLTLSDPKGFVHFPLTRADRVLTGADFDPESIVRAPDGTYWIGEEFGPYLLHFDRAGRLLQRPIPVPGVKTKNSPDLVPGETPNLGNSKGLESLAISPDGSKLYPMLEGPVTGDDPQHLRLYEFDRRDAAFTGRRWTYRMEAPGLAAADLVAVDENRFVAIERDNLQGDAAAVKKIYLVDTTDQDAEGQVDKSEVVDLLNIANPHGLGVPGETFRFPFFTIEAVVVLGDRTLGVLNDNNFPMDAARTPGSADANEFITVRLPERLTSRR